ncbi:caspase family protein [Streptomyces sp. NPDC001581]|uniref:caspase family protein n=1 Tax=Streptomyces sp. NPDC001581 TaxID=3154386 RepID=UPI0033247E2F
MTDRPKKALIVVTGTYGDSQLTALRAPPQDAAALAEVLGDPTIGDFDVAVLRDPGCQELREAVEEFFAERAAEHTLLLHFSCHGLKDGSGTLYLATKDTRCVRLASTAVPAEFVSGLMLASVARRAVVVLDCCYAGAFERGILTRADTDAHVEDSFQTLGRMGGGSQRGRAVLAACGAVEFAREGTTAAPSFFTRTLVKGIRSGDADLDGDGEIGLTELHEYVCDELRELTPHQTPRLWVFGAHGGDLPIARAPARLAKPPPLPEEVAAHVRSRSPTRRLWAIEDLESLLHGDDIGLALAAATALERLSGDDSRRVADSAGKVMSSARPRVRQDSLDLGTIAMDSPMPAAVIAVEGAPLVHSTLEATADAPWLAAKQVTDGVEVRVKEVPQPGPHEARVLIRTATGEASVPVQVQVGRKYRPPKPDGISMEMGAISLLGHQSWKPPQPPPPRRPSEPLMHWPFTSAAVFLAVSLSVFPFAADLGSAFGSSAGWLTWPVVGVSIVVNTVVSLRARRDAAVPRSMASSWGYSALTVLLATGTFLLFGVYIRSPATIVAVLSLTCACIAMLIGAIALWGAALSG